MKGEDIACVGFYAWAIASFLILQVIWTVVKTYLCTFHEDTPEDFHYLYQTPSDSDTLASVLGKNHINHELCMELLYYV